MKTPDKIRNIYIFFKEVFEHVYRGPLRCFNKLTTKLAPYNKTCSAGPETGDVPEESNINC